MRHSFFWKEPKPSCYAPAQNFLSPHMRTIRKFFEVILMVIAVAIFSFFLAYAWPDSTYGLAAWVQAFGSIAAIGGAAWIASEQNRREQRRKDSDQLTNDLAAARTLLSLLLQAQVVAMNMEEHSKDFRREKLGPVISGLDAIRSITERILAKALSSEVIDCAVALHWGLTSAALNAGQAVATKGIIELATCESAARLLQSVILMEMEKMEAHVQKINTDLETLQ